MNTAKLTSRATPQWSRQPDKYASLDALMQAQRPESYRIVLKDRRSPVTVIAPHGGLIEPGTSALAHAIAGDKYNLFDFQGLQREAPRDLHVTATRFREPNLCQMLSRSRAAAAIHGMHTQGAETIFLGGLNRKLKGLVYRALTAVKFDVNPDSPLYRGEHPRNVVNLARGHGVQLEIPNELFAELFEGTLFNAHDENLVTTPRFEALVNAVRHGIHGFLIAA